MKRSFVHGALILMIAAAINRIIGFIYQAVIYRMIGPEGVGLFNLVYPVYILIIVMATGGIPLGISKLVSEEDVRGNLRLGYQILWLSLTILTVSGAVFSAGAYLVSPLLLRYVFVNKAVYPVFLCLTPGIFVISVSSAFRGFFQGLMHMKPPALGQVTEQVVRVCAGVYLAVILLPRGLQWAAAGLAAASIAGEATGLIVMAIIFRKQKPANFRIELPGITMSAHIIRKLFGMCTPITLGRLAATVMMSVDAVIIPVMLTKAGYTTSAATALFGQFTGVALTLLFIPSVITIALATSLVPAISDAVAQNRLSLVSSRTSEAFRVTLIAGIPFIAAFLVLPDEIARVIYGPSEGGKILGVLATGGLLAYLQQTSTGVLQGLGKPVTPLLNTIAGGIVKVVLIVTLTRIPGIGILGTAVAYDAFFLVSAVLNLACLHRQTGFHVNLLNDIIKPVLAGLAAAFVYHHAYSWLCIFSGNDAKSVAPALMLGFGAYLTAVTCLGAVNKKDYHRIPVLGPYLYRRRI